MNREKVLTGLSVVRTWAEFCEEQGLLMDDGMIRDTARYVRAAYEWIKKSEPRLMTIDEVQGLEKDTDIWVERTYITGGVSAFYALTVESNDGEFLRCCAGRSFPMDHYNRWKFGWRVWTARATEKQRKAELWDEVNYHGS